MRTTDAKPQKRTWLDRVRTAFKANDEAALEEALEESKTEDEEGEEENKEKAKTGDSATLDAILKAVNSLSTRVGDMEGKLEGLTEDEDEEDDKGKTEDDILNAEEAEHNSEASGKTYTGDAALLTDLRSRAEILAPGITFGTRDSKVKTTDHICACQRQALNKAMATDGGKAIVEPFLMGRALDKMTADQVAAAFTGASELAKQRNNAAGTRTSITTKDFGRTTSVSDINKRNREFWSQGRQ